jgi:hypothetical protein
MHKASMLRTVALDLYYLHQYHYYPHYQYHFNHILHRHTAERIL